MTTLKGAIDMITYFRTHFVCTKHKMIKPLSLVSLTTKTLSIALTFSGLRTVSAMSTHKTKVIDSHLHIWGQPDSNYPYAQGQTPTDNLINKSSVSDLLENMDKTNVDGSLIVQPINYKYDHDYVAEAIAAHPDRLKGMLLYDPSLDEKDAIGKLQDLLLKGFVGVRFNPYLWPEGSKMSAPNSAGLAVYKKCGELKMPVGIMCFKGLPLHYTDIVDLLEASPDTVMILDHFGFTRMADDDNDNEAFEQLLSLAQYPNVYVKISALFRIADPELANIESPRFEHLQYCRFEPLLAAFGCERLMMGTDFPFVLNEKGGYVDAVGTVDRWCGKNEEARGWIMGGTAEKVFGSWGIKK